MELFAYIGILLDIVAVVLVVIPIIQGFRKGFKRRLLSLVALAVSAVVAYVVSGLFAPPIYNSYLKDKTQTMCVNAVKSVDPVSIAKQALAEKGVDISEERVREIMSQADTDQLQAVRQAAQEYGFDTESAAELAEQYGEMLPEKAAALIKDQAPQIADAISSGKISDVQLSETMKALVESPEEAGGYIEENYAAPLVTSGIEAALYTAVFVVMQLIMLVMFMLFGYDLKKNAETGGDRFAGVMLGLVCAAASLLMMCIVMSGIIKASNGMIDINSMKSAIFIPLYKIIY